MSVRTDRLVPCLRSCLAAIAADDRAALIRSVGGITPTMAMLYAEPVATNYRGERVADRGAGEAFMLARQLRASVAELPTHSGLGGVVFDPTWILAQLDYLLALLDR